MELMIASVALNILIAAFWFYLPWIIIGVMILFAVAKFVDHNDPSRVPKPNRRKR